MSALSDFMKRSIAMAFVVFVASLVLLSSPVQAKYAAIVIDSDTGRVLFSRNADTRLYPASLTKMMTLYMAFDALKAGKISMNRRLKVSRRAEGIAPGKLGLKRGQTIKVKDAILGLVTKSANDAAVVIAEALGGTESHFAAMMTKKAKALGMTRTSFKNASGLPNRRQLSTARDMSKLGRALLRDHPEYYDLFSTNSFRYKKRIYKNHNNLLNNYKGTDGIKTGYTHASGFNLVASVKRNNRRLIGVVFGGRTGTSRDRHMRDILNKSFKRLPAIRTAKAMPPRPKHNPKRVSEKIVLAAVQKTMPPLPKHNPKRVSEARYIVQLLAPVPRPASHAKSNEVASLQGSALSVAPRGKWGIQVGAFADYERAKSVAKDALLKLGDKASFAATNIQSHSAQSERIYRARIVGMNESYAREACETLKESSISCFALPPHS